MNIFIDDASDLIIQLFNVIVLALVYISMKRYWKVYNKKLDLLTRLCLLMIALSILFPAVIKLPLKPQKLIEYGNYEGFYE